MPTASSSCMGGKSTTMPVSVPQSARGITLQDRTKGSVNFGRRTGPKSRYGCTSCKARKIKCGEEQPICSACRIRRSACHYPSQLHSARTAPGHHIFPVHRNPPRETKLYSIRDMQYFHYFLTTLSHPLPVGNKSVWQHEIPQIAHQHPFLLHAMLAFSVADLARVRGPGTDRSMELFQYRGKAISGLQKAINDTSAWETYGHVDAILGASYLLVYQSSLMPDGDRDFDTFTHGCALTTSAIQQRKFKTALKVGESWPLERLADALSLLIPLSLPDPIVGFIKRAISSLDSFRGLAQDSTLYPFWTAQYQMCSLFTVNPHQAYLSSLNNFNNWYFLAKGLITSMREPSNRSLAIVTIASYLANIAWSKVLIPLHLWNPENQAKLLSQPVPIIPIKPTPIGSLREASQWIEAMKLALPEKDHDKLAFSRTTLRRFSHQPAQAFLAWQDGGGGAAVAAAADVDFAEKLATLNDLTKKAHIFLGSILRIGADLAMWFEDALLERHSAVVTRGMNDGMVIAS